MKLLPTLAIAGSLMALPLGRVQAAEPTATPFVLNGAQTFTLTSQTNGREYQIFVSAPQGEVPPQGFPVIYTSDGNAMFPQLLATANLLRQSSRVVIVGIGYPGDTAFDVSRRYFDLTPKTSEEAMRASGRDIARETGGNDLFLDFLEKELKPLIEKRYRIDRQKQTLFGHSLGGLLVLHALYQRPGTFQNYVAAAPSIWWNGLSVLDEEKEFLARYKNPQLPLKVLITSNEDTTARPALAATAATPANAQGLTGKPQDAIGKAEIVVGHLKELAGVTAEYRVFNDETHISMVPPSITAALRFALGDAPRSRPGQAPGQVATPPTP